MAYSLVSGYKSFSSGKLNAYMLYTFTSRESMLQCCFNLSPRVESLLQAAVDFLLK
jgi:hypothetical protein